ANPIVGRKKSTKHVTNSATRIGVGPSSTAGLFRDLPAGQAIRAGRCAAEQAYPRLEHQLVPLHHSMTSVARARIIGDTVRPSVLAVLRLTTNSNLVGCWIGRSAGLVPLRILPA